MICLCFFTMRHLIWEITVAHCRKSEEDRLCLLWLHQAHFFTAVFTLCFCNWKLTFMQKCQSVGGGNRRAFLCVIIPPEAQGVYFSLCLIYVNCHQWKWEAYKTNTDHSRLFYNCFRTCPLLILLLAKFSKQQ